MALGGGLWTSQNKVLPGTYINFSNAAKATSLLSERGIVAMPMTLDWGPEGEVFEVTLEDFKDNCKKLLGHDMNSAAMLPFRELFKHAKTVFVYRLNSGGNKASNTYCEARFTGSAGNSIKTVIKADVDDDTSYKVETYIGTELVDTQTVGSASALRDNSYVVFKKSASLTATAGTPLTGGSDGTAGNSAYQNCLNKLENYSFNVLGCPSTDSTTINLFVAYTKRMRDEIGVKFQTVIYNQFDNANITDCEAVVEVGNSVTDSIGAYGLVYWAAGALAGCEINKALTNQIYDGELNVSINYTWNQLEAAIKAGRFMLHNVNNEARVLEDINSLITETDTKGESFKANQTIRICDYIANAVATLFATKYMGTVANDNAGRIALWNDVCNICKDLESKRAIENFETDSITVVPGDKPKAVLVSMNGLHVTNAMAQLYMNVVIE